MSSAKCTISRDQTWSRSAANPLFIFAVCFAALLDLPARGEDDFASRLSSFAAKCDDLGLAEQAEITRRWNIARHPGRHYLFLPPAGESSAPKANAPANVRFWHDKFLELRRLHAADLFAEARAASDQRNAPRAYQLLYEVLREDPDHPEGRRILGFLKRPGGEWVLPDWEKLVAEPSRTDHPRLGWRARTFFRLETPHFQIITNHSKPELLEAGRQLEDLHTLWRQIFFRYWSSPEALAARFAGGNESLSRPRPKMQVVLFKNRQDYISKLMPAEPLVAATKGFYDYSNRVAYFFAGDTSVYPTWYHEATHQLFMEAREGATAEPGGERNFWAVEGAALYMESLATANGCWTAGGCEADRLQLTRYRALSGDFSIPLERLSALGREALQNSPDLKPLYGYSAGLAHFFIDGHGGKYREAFVDLLTAIYRGEDAADSLTKATGQPLATLDQQFREFLNVTDADLAGVTNPENIRNLSLGRTSVTDQGLSHLAGCKNLQWLDLTTTATTAEGLKHFAAASGLKQLFLEGTKIADASLPLIAAFKQLEELDLANLAITDDGLTAIANMRTLKVLYLAGSPITDAGLVHLRNLKQLQQLETDRTKITPDGLKKLRAALPKLKSLPSVPSP